MTDPHKTLPHSRCGDHEFHVFDPLAYADDEGLSLADATAMALRCRNAMLRELRRRGVTNCKGWTLTGQLRKYKGFGVPDGRMRNVYYITVYPNATEGAAR